MPGPPCHQHNSPFLRPPRPLATRATLVHPGFCVKRGGDGGAASSSDDAQDGCAAKVRPRRARRFSPIRRVSTARTPCPIVSRSEIACLSGSFNTEPGLAARDGHSPLGPEVRTPPLDIAGAPRSGPSRTTLSRRVAGPNPCQPCTRALVARRPLPRGRGSAAAASSVLEPASVITAFDIREPRLSLRACRRLLQNVSFPSDLLASSACPPRRTLSLSHGYKPVPRI